MAIDPVLRPLLVCPADKGKLSLQKSGLRCETCEADYPVIDGIPDMRP